MKKGFTLVELLAVIILLGLLGLIIYPTVNGVINTNKRKLHDKQMEELIRHANTYATTNITKLKTRYGSKNIVTLTDLYEAGIIQSDKVVDPLTDKELNGCLILMWNRARNEFDIEYTETCNKYGSISGVIKGNSYKYAKITGTSPIEATVSLVQEDQVYYTTQSDEDGNYSFNNVEVGNYILLVSQSGKTKQGEEVVIDGNVTKDMTVTLWYSDYNNDNIINRVDYNLWREHCEIPYKLDDIFTHDSCDIDRDTNVNSNDRNAIANSYVIGSKMTQITLRGTFNLSGKVISNDAMPTEVELMNNDNTYTASIKADGTYEFRNIPKGTYRLRSRLQSYSLHDTYNIYLGDVDNVDIYIYHGDFDSSGAIDEGDIEALKSVIKYGYDISDPYDKLFDLNNDNVIDNADIAVLRKTMAEYQSRYR